MKRDLTRLTSEQFDLLIIGGGATGCFTARDAAMRGLSVALIEARDFAWATSATERPRSAASRAVKAPVAPPPTIRTSKFWEESR